KILQSAFPTKTFLFLVVLGAAAYYFVDIRYADWADAVLESHGDDPLATPLHFYKDREELDHWIHAHVPDPAGPARDPNLLQAINAQFEKLVLGWRMNEDEAREANLPITHGCQMKSNQACEDTYALGTSPGPGGLPWNYWGVYDGHAGRFTSMHLQWHLIPQLSRALSNVSPQSSSNVIADTIMAAFVRVDDDMMARAKHAASWYPAANNVALHTLAPAFSGSCALLAAFDPEKDKLRIACTGDSRAVLGRWDALEQKYICKPLSVDQTGFNQDEVERIKAAHPDEPEILNPDSGRLLGLAVTRAFGDHRWKWENGFIRTLQAKFWGTPPRPNSRTPPYLTAEPVVTETDVVRVEPHPSSPVKSDFMILASDGLWDRISSEHAVECVSRWIDARDR
ncbi:protein serine/threonine phosphatase 2C, partial [Corynespora cassiicola Philippines]